MSSSYNTEGKDSTSKKQIWIEFVHGLAAAIFLVGFTVGLTYFGKWLEASH